MATNENPTVRIEDFILSMLNLLGLKRGTDYKVSGSQLWVKDKDKIDKLIGALKRTYPEYSYYWETPQILRWY